MNVADLTLLIVIIVFALRGASRGAGREFLGVVGFVGAIAAAASLAPRFAPIFEAKTNLPMPVVVGMTFMGVFMLINVAVGLTGLIVTRRPTAAPYPLVARVGGAIFGATKVAVTISFVLLCCHILRVSPRLDGLLSASLLARPLVSAAQGLLQADISTSPPAAPEPQA